MIQETSKEIKPVHVKSHAFCILCRPAVPLQRRNDHAILGHGHLAAELFSCEQIRRFLQELDLGRLARIVEDEGVCGLVESEIVLRGTWTSSHAE